MVPSFWKSFFKRNSKKNGNQLNEDVNNVNALNSPLTFESKIISNETISNQHVGISLVDMNQSNSNQDEIEPARNLSCLERCNKKFKIYWKRYFGFTTSPRVHFVYDTLFYTIFLIIFSYMLLCEFKYYGEEISFSNETLNSTDISEKNNSTEYLIGKFYFTHGAITYEKMVQMPTFIEYLIIFWIISFFAEELNQVVDNVEIFFKTFYISLTFFFLLFS